MAAEEDDGGLTGEFLHSEIITTKYVLRRALRGLWISDLFIAQNETRTGIIFTLRNSFSVRHGTG